MQWQWPSPALRRPLLQLSAAWEGSYTLIISLGTCDTVYMNESGRRKIFFESRSIVTWLQMDPSARIQHCNGRFALQVRLHVSSCCGEQIPASLLRFRSAPSTIARLSATLSSSHLLSFRLTSAGNRSPTFAGKPSEPSREIFYFTAFRSG